MFIYLTGSNLFVTSQQATNNSNRGVTLEVLKTLNYYLLLTDTPPIHYSVALSVISLQWPGDMDNLLLLQ